MARYFRKTLRNKKKNRLNTSTKKQRYQRRYIKKNRKTIRRIKGGVREVDDYFGNIKNLLGLMGYEEGTHYTMISIDRKNKLESDGYSALKDIKKFKNFNSIIINTIIIFKIEQKIETHIVYQIFRTTFSLALLLTFNIARLEGKKIIINDEYKDIRDAEGQNIDELADLDEIKIMVYTDLNIMEDKCKNLFEIYKEKYGDSLLPPSSNDDALTVVKSPGVFSSNILPKSLKQIGKANTMKIIRNDPIIYPEKISSKDDYDKPVDFSVKTKKDTNLPPVKRNNFFI